MPNERKALSSDLRVLFITSIVILFIVALSIAIYSLIIKDYSGFIAGLVFGIFNYIIFARNIFRLKRITFDKNYFYFKNGSKIELSQIETIENGMITYIEKDKRKILFVNPFYPAKNHRLFYKYFKSKK